MRVIRKIGYMVYLLASVAVLGAMAAWLFGNPSVALRLRHLLATPYFRPTLAVCMAVVAVRVLASAIVGLTRKRELEFVHPGGNESIEVAVPALENAARIAAESDVVMVEDVEGHVTGRGDGARLRVQAIALTDEGLEGLAQHVQLSVKEACERMLGCEGVSVQVRFLPSKTVTKEVPVASATMTKEAQR